MYTNNRIIKGIFNLITWCRYSGKFSLKIILIHNIVLSQYTYLLNHNILYKTKIIVFIYKTVICNIGIHKLIKIN